jgi:hypothetical protein
VCLCYVSLGLDYNDTSPLKALPRAPSPLLQYRMESPPEYCTRHRKSRLASTFFKKHRNINSGNRAAGPATIGSGTFFQGSLVSIMQRASEQPLPVRGVAKRLVKMSPCTSGRSNALTGGHLYLQSPAIHSGAQGRAMALGLKSKVPGWLR